MPKNQESLADAIQRAQEIPDDHGKGANVSIPNLFGTFPIPTGEPVISNIPLPESQKRVAGLPKYNLEAHLERFIVGSLIIEQGDGQIEVQAQDDSPEYEKLLNKALNGEVIIRWEEKQTLKDGTFVITVCYFTLKYPPKSNKQSL